MRSSSNSVIYNYSVDISETGVTAPLVDDETQIGEKRLMGLETYLKHKVMGQQAEALR
jgi:hypothetical protein